MAPGDSGMAFTDFRNRLRQLVRNGHGDREIDVAIASLCEAACSIFYDMERIDDNMLMPE